MARPGWRQAGGIASRQERRLSRYNDIVRRTISENFSVSEEPSLVYIIQSAYVPNTARERSTDVTEDAPGRRARNEVY